MVLTLAFLLLAAAFGLAFIRMVRDPKRDHRLLTLDRVVALDLMSTLSIGLITLLAVAFNRPLMLDAAIVIALLAFLSTVAFARYLEKGKQ